MSNCHLVAGRSLIDLTASRLALRAPALRAATALTRPNRSAQRLPCGRHAVPTTKTVGPSDVVANHRIKCRDHLAQVGPELVVSASPEPPSAIPAEPTAGFTERNRTGILSIARRP